MEVTSNNQSGGVTAGKIVTKISIKQTWIYRAEGGIFGIILGFLITYRQEILVIIQKLIHV